MRELKTLGKKKGGEGNTPKIVSTNTECNPGLLNLSSNPHPSRLEPTQTFIRRPGH